jgi:hypothetical protein
MGKTWLCAEVWGLERKEQTAVRLMRLNHSLRTAIVAPAYRNRLFVSVETVRTYTERLLATQLHTLLERGCELAGTDAKRVHEFINHNGTIFHCIS